MEINKLSYPSIYLSEGWSFISCEGGWGGSHFEKAENMFKPPPPPRQIHPSFLEMIPPHSLLPSIIPPPPPPAVPHILAINRADVHCVLYPQSCVWDRCLQFTVVAFNFNARSLYSAQIYFHETIKITPSPLPPPHVTVPYLKMTPQNESRFWKKKCLDQQQIHLYLTLAFYFLFVPTGP